MIKASEIGLMASFILGCQAKEETIEESSIIISCALFALSTLGLAIYCCAGRKIINAATYNPSEDLEKAQRIKIIVHVPGLTNRSFTIDQLSDDD